MNVLMVSTDRRILEEGSARAWLNTERFATSCILLLRQSGEKKDRSNREKCFYSPYSLLLQVIFSPVAFSSKNLITSDLVTTQDPFETGLIAWLIAKKTKAKLQLQIHTDFLSPYFAKESILNKIRVLIAKFILPKADCIRAASLRISDSLTANNYKLKTSPAVLPIFIDAPKIMSAAPQFNLHKKYPQFDFIVLTTARLEPEKT